MTSQVIGIDAGSRTRAEAEHVLHEFLGGARLGHLVACTHVVRPVWSHGDLVLRVPPSSGGMLAPFEVRDQGPCCGGH
ncbi:MAG: hypothetical protein ACRDWI_00035 [Jiangellaceae bacterium]